MKKPDDAWFVVDRTPNEISATPANARGWFALVGWILATGAVAVGAFLALLPWSAAVAGVAMGATITLGVLATVRLAVAKGRARSDR